MSSTMRRRTACICMAIYLYPCIYADTQKLPSPPETTPSEVVNTFLKKQETKLSPESKNTETKEITRGLSNQSLVEQELDKMYEHPELTAHKVSLQMHDADVKMVVDMIGRAAKINFAIDQAIKGKISTINVKDCDAGHALKIIFDQTNPQASAVKVGTIWHVTTRENARKLLQTALAKDQIHKVFPLNHVQIDESFSKRIKEAWTSIMPEGASPLHIDEEQRKIFAHGPRPQLEEFEQFLSEIDQPLVQIRIDIILVLARKEVNFDFGIDWSGIYNRTQTLKEHGTKFGLAGIGGTVLDFPTPSSQVQNPPNEQPNANLLINPLDFALNLFNSGLKFYDTETKNKNELGLIRIPFIFGDSTLNLRRLNMILNMAEVENKINIVSRPSILTSNNKTARILSGESLPLQTMIEDTNGTTSRNLASVNYKEVGLIIEVTPQVSLDRKTVFLNISIEDSAVMSGTTKANDKGIMLNPPVLSVIRAKNQVLLKDGQTTIVGGLTIQDRRDKRTAVPFLSEIPILGNIFKGSFKQSADFERYIFITPTIVQQEV